MRKNGLIIFLHLIIFLISAFPVPAQMNDSLSLAALHNADSSNATIVIGDISVKGYKKTKLYNIQREIHFKRGQT